MIIVEVVQENLIWLRGVTAKFDQHARVAIEGLPDHDILVADIPPERWNSDKEEQAKLAKPVTTRKTMIDIPIYFIRDYHSIDKARKAFRDNELECSNSYFIGTPEPQNLWWTVMLDQSFKKLWWVKDDLRPTYLYMNNICIGFIMSYAGVKKDDRIAIIGTPQVSE